MNDSEKKQLVEDELRKTSEDAASAGMNENTYLDRPYGARRKKAIINYIDRAESEFSKLGLESAAGEFVDNELSLWNNYNILDSECDLRIAAALWILERLRACGKMAEVYRIIPDTAGDVEACCLQPDFHHPCFDNDLIQSVVYVITKRYREPGVITEENAKGKKPDDRYRALIDLIPESDIKTSCDVFKSMLWELAARKMKGKAYYIEEIDQVFRKIRSASAGLLMDHPVPGPLADPLGRNAKISGKPWYAGMSLLSGLDRQPLPEGVWSDIDNTAVNVERGEELLDQAEDFEVKFDDYLLMDKKQVRRESGSRKVAEALDGFRVEDPYELCFALFYLIDNGDDAPWLIGSGSSLMLYVIRMLPWFVNQEDWDDEEWDEWLNGITYDRNGWLNREAPDEQLDYYHEMHGDQNLAQVIYGLCRGIVPVGLHPFEADREKLIAEGMEEDKARKVTDIAEMMFLHEFQAKLYDKAEWGFDDENEDEGEGEDEGESEHARDDVSGDDGFDGVDEPSGQGAGQRGMPVSPGGYRGKVAASQGLNTESTEQSENAAPDDDAAIKIELENLRKQVKSLKAALSTEKRAADAERSRNERELKALRMEHRELADLRSIIFNQENTVKEAPACEYTYPYETRRKTVIFGGHEAFLKSIRQMLPSVKYVNADNLSFSPEIIKNADVVWIQNNCISHSQYWTIVRNCKLAGVQMRYFSYSSAEKCAEQLVTEDQKR